jgi:hypothetical protein
VLFNEVLARFLFVNDDCFIEGHRTCYQHHEKNIEWKVFAIVKPKTVGRYKLAGGYILVSNEDYKKLQKNEQFNTEQVATSVRCSHIFRTLETMVECALEQNDEQILKDTVDKVGMYIIRSLR